MTVNTGRTAQLERRKLHRRVAGERLLRGSLSFVLGVLLAGAETQGSAMGAGTAYVGASGPGVAGFLALLGAGAGYLLRYGLENSTQYLASSVMVYTVAFVCQYLSVSGRKWFMPGAVMLMIGLTTAFGTVSTPRYEMSYLVDLAGEVVLCGALTYIYHKAMAGSRDALYCTAEEYYARLLLLASVCNALIGFEFGGYVDMGCALAVWLVMAAAYDNKTPYAVSGAGLVGVVMGGGSAVLYGVNAFAAKLFGGNSKWRFLAAYVGAGGLLIGTCCDARNMPAELYTLCAAGMLYAFYGGDGRTLSVLSPLDVSDVGEAYFRRRESERLQQTAKALEAVAHRLITGEVREEDGDVLSVMDRAMDSVCENCGKRHSCRSSRRVDMLDLFMSTAGEVIRRGRMSEHDLPDIFRERCYEYKSLVLAVNHELRHHTEEVLRLRTAEETLRICGMQYEMFGGMLRQMSVELERFSGNAKREQLLVSRYLQQEKLRCSVGAFYNRSKRLTLQIFGEDVGKLTARRGYLDELSRLLGVRLCMPAYDADCVTLYEAEPLAVTIGIASRRKRGERLSGDRVKQFKTEQGKLFIILSDGMGTGSYAWEQSGHVIACLEELLRCGMDAETSMELLNSLSYFKNREDWGYATVDLLELNLFSGQADFYKLGAADSYIFDGQAVHVVSGDSLPVGMETGESVHPDHLSLRMKPGMSGILVSDGIVPTDNAALEDLFREEGHSMKALSRRILTSDRKSAGEDDMTVVAFGLEIRK